MSTHIRDDAKFAKTVLMPGDPYRAKWMAETFLVDYKLVSDVRGILAFTGKTKDGKEISIMASGMGVPSIAIYSYELYTFYGVEKIIRVGTAGGYLPELHVGDIIIATSSSTNSNFAAYFENHGIHVAPCSDFSMILSAYESAKAKGLPVHVGPILSSDNFYNFDSNFPKYAKELGILAVEMESYGLFLNAMRLGKKALCLLTISDSLVNDEKDMTQEERQTQLIKMVDLAISIA